MPTRARPATSPGRRRILIVDDHPLLREGLARRLEREPDLAVCGEAANASQALSAAEHLEPDLVLLDINLPGRSGLEFIRDLRAVAPTVPVLVLSMHDESVFAERVLRAGARGYVSKEADAADLLRAIRQVLGGQIHLSERVSTRLLGSLAGDTTKGTPSPIARLTDRELEVFTLIGQAKETRSIARRLNMSVKTVEAHRAAIKRKLHLESGPELTRHAVLWVEATH